MWLTNLLECIIQRIIYYLVKICVGKVEAIFENFCIHITYDLQNILLQSLST